MKKILLREQEAYWKKNDKINVMLTEQHIRYLASLLREDDNSGDTSEWRQNSKKDLRFLLHLNGK